MAFVDQVQDLTSLTVSDTDELSQFLKDGVLDVTNRWLSIRPQDIELFGRESSETTSNASLNLNGARIISVIREDGTNNQWRNCRKISPALQYDVTDVDSLNYASKINPAYMIGDAGKISVFPTPGSDPNAFKAYYVNKDPVNSSGSALVHSHDDILYFPIDKTYLVVMYAGIRALHAAMGATTITDLTVTVVPPDAPLTPSFSAASVSAVTNRAISASAPTYTSPTTTISGTAWATAYPDQYSAITTAWTAVNAEIDECLSIADDMHEQITSAEAAYDKFQADGGDPALFGDETQYLTGVGLAHVKDALDNARTIIDDGANSPTGNAAGDADTYLYTDEDTELLQGALGIASSEIQRANAHIADWNAAVQSLSAEGQGFLATSQGFGAEIQSKLGVANSYIAEINSRLSNVQPKIGEYQSKVKDALNEFNQENIAYQQDIQEALGEMQVAAAAAQKKADFDQQTPIQEYANKLQKFQMEYAGYTAEVNEQVQAYTQNLQADGVGYQWLQDQYNRLKAEYDAAFMIAAPKPAPQPARR